MPVKDKNNERKITHRGSVVDTHRDEERILYYKIKVHIFILNLILQDFVNAKSYFSGL
jgi:hypothetical protein